jgi:hypothetical protein
MRFPSVKRILWMIVMCAGGAGLSAQTATEQAPAPKPTVKTAPAAPVAYVRKFSMGGSLSFGLLSTMKSSNYTNKVTDVVDDTESGTIKSQAKFAAGPTFQFAFLEHFALNVSVLRNTEHHWDYNMTRYDGKDLDTTTADDRIKTTEKHNTWARNYDIPVLLRYYRKGHHVKGWRYFGEAGITARQTRDERTARDITYYDPAKVKAGLDYTTYATFENPDRANKKNMLGFTAGVGAQFNDSFGLRIVPEIRYTHWTGATWEINSVKSTKSKVEAVFTITF